MMKCVFVCHEKSSLPTFELSVGGAKRDVRQALPAVGWLWPSDDYDDDDEDDVWHVCGGRDNYVDYAKFV